MTPFEPFALAPAAFLAGVLMFLAPCTLPLVPGYLAFIAGGTGKRRVVVNALAFVIGFSIIFILLGSFAGFFGALIGPWRDTLGRAAGALLILFGLTMLGWLRIPGLSGEWHARVPRFLTLGHPQSSFIIGVLFAVGWSPCIGPILGTVLLFASTSSTAVTGAVLLGVFSLGLALPFLLTAILIDSASVHFARWGRATQVLSYVGGAVLIILGILMLLGKMGLLITWGYSVFDFIGYDRLLQYL